MLPAIASNILRPDYPDSMWNLVYAESSFALMGTGFMCLILALLAWVPWRMPQRPWWVTVLLLFCAAIPYGALSFNGTRWLSPYGWMSETPLWSMINTFAVGASLVVIVAAAIPKAPQRLLRIAVAAVLFCLLLLGATLGNHNPFMLPVVCASCALLGVLVKGRMNPWGTAVLLAVLSASLFLASGSPTLPWAFGCIVLFALGTTDEGPCPPLAWMGLVLLVAGFGAIRYFDSQALEWDAFESRVLNDYRRRINAPEPRPQSPDDRPTKAGAATPASPEAG